MKKAREYVNYKQTINRRKLIFLAETGSRMLGLSTDATSDIDETGVSLEKPADLLGFSPFESEVYRTAEDRTGKIGVKSEAGDIDLSVYGLRKFVKMCLTGNPNLISLLFLPKEMFSVYTPVMRELQELAPSIVSLKAVKAFLGYMQAQKLRLMGERGQLRVHRPELVEEHGFDTKYGMHVMRLGIQGADLAKTGRLSFPLSADYKSYLLEVRSGSYSLNTLITHARSYEELMQNRLEANPANLRPEPEYDRIERWLLNVYEKEWYEAAKTSQQQGTEADSSGQDASASPTDGEKIEDIVF